MTLNIGETVLLDAIVHVEEKADKLHLEYNRDVFELTLLKKFTIAKGENYDEKALKIKCKKTFSTIKVIATKNKLTQKVGKINVLPNDKIKSVNILIIPVKYSGKRGSIKNLKEKEYIINSFGQALIRATIEDYPFELIVGDWFSDLFFTTKDKKGNKVMDISSYKSIHQYLDDKFMNIKGNNKYDSYYRVYCLPSSLNLNGIAEDVGNGAKAVVVFQNRDNYTTMIHEILHAVGLYHTFDNNTKHTFKLYGTDNIMDYTHHKGKNRFTTTCWQWKVLRKNIKL